MHPENQYPVTGSFRQLLKIGQAIVPSPAHYGIIFQLHLPYIHQCLFTRQGCGFDIKGTDGINICFFVLTSPVAFGLFSRRISSWIEWTISRRIDQLIRHRIATDLYRLTGFHFQRFHHLPIDRKPLQLPVIHTRPALRDP